MRVSRCCPSRNLCPELWGFLKQLLKWFRKEQDLCLLDGPLGTWAWDSHLGEEIISNTAVNSNLCCSLIFTSAARGIVLVQTQNKSSIGRFAKTWMLLWSSSNVLFFPFLVWKALYYASSLWSNAVSRYKGEWNEMLGFSGEGGKRVGNATWNKQQSVKWSVHI